MTKEARRYYRKVKTLIPSKGKYEISMLKSIRLRIAGLENSQDDLTYDDFCNIIGAPQDVIYNYYETVDIDYLIERLRTTKIVRRCAYIALVVIIMCSTIVAGYYYSAYIKSTSTIIDNKQPVIFIEKRNTNDEKK